MALDRLHTFAEEHIDADCARLTGLHDNGLFFNCKFNKLNGLVLKDCDLNRSKFVTDSLQDALGFTLTLGCKSFRNVEYSEKLIDLMLCLLIMTKGNDAKREKLLDVIGRDKAALLLRTLKRFE